MSFSATARNSAYVSSFPDRYTEDDSFSVAIVNSGLAVNTSADSVNLDGYYFLTLGNSATLQFTASGANWGADISDVSVVQISNPVLTFYNNNCNCPDVPQSVTDPDGTKMLDLMQADVNAPVFASLSMTTAPDLTTGYTWLFDSASGWSPLSGDFAANGIPSSVTWTSGGDRRGSVQGISPYVGALRHLSYEVAYFNDLTFQNLTPGVVNASEQHLGLGEQGTITVNTVEPDDRTLCWDWIPICHNDPNKSLHILTQSPSGPNNRQWTLTAATDSDSGTIRVRVWDSRHPYCVIRDMLILIGCQSCAQCNSGNLGVAGATSAQIHSLHYTLALGGLYGGGSLGQASLDIETPFALQYSPNALGLPHSAVEMDTNRLSVVAAINGSWSDGTRSLVDTNGVIRQFLVPDGLLDIQVIDPYSYTMAFYPNTAVGSFSTNRSVYTIPDPSA